jgi:phenylalanyl-tRNA synthetase beta chain
MKISINTTAFLNEHYQSAGNPAPDGVDALVEKIGAQLGAVEEVIPFGAKFEGVLIVKIMSCVDHPNSDHLHICKIDDGGKAENVERDENGYVQVVCGAPNVREGLTVAWLPPGATVPETYDKDPFVLKARPLRGEVSNGMLASARELSLGDSHDGILEIDAHHGQKIAPGTAFVDAYRLRGDVVIDMENKMFTHRPDCFGWLGIAREIEGISHRRYKSPEWYTLTPEFPAVEADVLPLEVINELPELVPRFTALTLRNVTVKQSPVWLQVELAKAGLRPINNIVDYTNYFMLETGQPLHAYDYDKVKALSNGESATITVRNPKPDEKILLLNGKEVQPRAEAIMIATDKQAIGIGGVMGGGDTEVDEHTKNIILEVATFDMYSIRRTSMAHGLFTDAVTRFNKGQSPLQNLAVLAKITDEIRRFADGKVASPVIDVNHLSEAAMERGSLHPPVQVSRDFINNRLGWDLTATDIETLLENVEFRVDVHDEMLSVAAPYWRTDIEIPEDVVEEVGRLYGYDHLPMDLPHRDLTPAIKDPMLTIKAQIRDALADAGANEVLTYSFVHGNLLEKVGQKPDNAFQLSNALSPDLQYYRMSLVPNLLDRVHQNIKAGYNHFALFELGKTHNLLHADDDNGLPTEFDMLGFVVTTDDKAVVAGSGAAYYEARTYLEFLANRFGFELEYTQLAEPHDYPVMTPYDHTRSAIVSVKGGEQLGIIGEFKRSVLKKLKLPTHTAGFEIGPKSLRNSIQSISRYRALPRFPKVEQDICLKVSADTPYAAVYAMADQHIAANRPQDTHYTLKPLDIYQRTDDTAHKQITLRVTIASYERTLTDDVVSKLLNDVADAAAQAMHAERI